MTNNCYLMQWRDLLKTMLEAKMISGNAKKIRETCSYENICKEWVQSIQRVN